MRLEEAINNLQLVAAGQAHAYRVEIDTVIRKAREAESLKLLLKEKDDQLLIARDNCKQLYRLLGGS